LKLVKGFGRKARARQQLISAINRGVITDGQDVIDDLQEALDEGLRRKKEVSHNLIVVC